MPFYRLLNAALFSLTTALSPSQSECLNLSELTAGKSIGTMVSNMETLRESLTPAHRFFAFYFCEDPTADSNRLTGL